MTLRTFTIEPLASEDDEETPEALVLRCDVVDPSAAFTAIAVNDISIIGQLSNSSNGALLGSISVGDDTEFSVVIKPAMYENPLWDFEWGTLAKREVAAYELSQLLGWNLVPPTVLRDVNDMQSSVQLFIPHDPRQHYFTIAPHRHAEMEKFIVFDYLCNNADRKGGHVVAEESESFVFTPSIDDRPADDSMAHSHAPQRAFAPETASQPVQHLWGIDHGLTFHVEDKLRTVMWEYSEQQISEQLMVDINHSFTKFEETLKPLLNEHEVKATVVRAEQLLINPYHRALDANSRAFPWPLV